MNLNDFCLVPRKIPFELAQELSGQDAHQCRATYESLVEHMLNQGNACTLSLPGKPIKPSELELNKLYIVESCGRREVCQLVIAHENIISAETFSYEFHRLGTRRSICVHVSEEDGELVDALETDVWELAQCK